MGALAVFGLKFGRWMAGALPIETVSATGGWLGRNLGPRTRRQRRVLENLGRALPAATEAERRRYALEMWDNFGRVIAEGMILDRIAADSGRVVLANPEVLEDASGGSRGTVFVGLHFGNWEATVIPALALKLELMGFYKASRDETFNVWLHGIREHLYPSGLLPGNGATLLKVTKHVRRGGSVCLLGDHRDASGIDVDFFGAPAPSTALPALLAVRYGARLIAARVDRHKGARFSVHIEPIEIARSNDEEADIRMTTQRLQGVFEEWVRARPGQWLWFYKRWLAQT